VASPLRRRGAFLALQTPALLRKWLPIAVLIGIVAGVGAIVFYEAIGLCTQFKLRGGRHAAARRGSRLVGLLPIEAVVRSYRAHVSSGVRDMKEVVQETLASTGDGRRGRGRRWL
jgi:hypothetical protein